MKHFSIKLLAQFLAILLLVIVIRALAEVFRLEHLRGDALTVSDVRPFIIGALAAALSLAAVLLAIWTARSAVAVALACITVAGLFVYRVYFFPAAGEAPAPTTPAAVSPPA
jgi:hypothetical protein